MFRDGRTDVHDEERSGWPSVVSDDLIQSVDQKICERRLFTFSELSCEFSQISQLFSTKLSQLGKAVTSFMLMGVHTMQKMASAVTFLKPYYKDGDEFLSHIV
jgi:hypothetical protein